MLLYGNIFLLSAVAGMGIRMKSGVIPQRLYQIQVTLIGLSQKTFSKSVILFVRVSLETRANKQTWPYPKEV